MQLKHFHGMVPKVPDENLQFNYATLAVDVDLRHGTLRPWRTAKLEKMTTPFTKTIHQYSHNCCWFEFDNCVEVAEWTEQCHRLYVTGDKPYPIVVPIHRDCSTGCGNWTELRLGIPAPTTALFARALPAKKPTNENYLPDAQERESRGYVYTYVNCLGEEGPPSYPSNHVDTDDGSPVSLTGFAIPPQEYGITHINVYRRVTGFRSEMDVQQGIVPDVTDYFHVGTIPVGQATHIDGGLNVNILGEALTTIDTLEPPEDLRGIFAIPNTRLLAGFVGNMLCFSMNNQPWNWPISQRYELDDNIVAIRSFGDKLFVMTDGHPYTVEINDGTNPRAIRAVYRHATAMPMVVCCSDRGAIATPNGVFYVSDRGIVAMGGEPTVITSQWFTTDDWRKLLPQTMRLGWHDGALFISSNSDTFVLQLGDSTFGQSNYNRLSKLSIQPKYYFTGRNGEMFYLYDNAIYQWEAGDEWMTYHWRSAVLDSRGYNSIGAVRLWSDGVTNMHVFAEGVDVFGEFEIMPNQSHRLPRYGHHLHHQVAFSGKNEVRSVELAYSRWELSTT